jgi:hypothetical protein
MGGWLVGKDDFRISFTLENHPGQEWCLVLIIVNSERKDFPVRIKKERG